MNDGLMRLSNERDKAACIVPVTSLARQDHGGASHPATVSTLPRRKKGATHINMPKDSNSLPSSSSSSSPPPPVSK